MSIREARGRAMTTRRRLILLAASMAVAATVGGLVYSRTRGPAPDDAGGKADDTPPPALVTKATTPARKLNEKEQMLVGTWKFEKVSPGSFARGYQATWEIAADGTYTFSFHDINVKHWSQKGKFRITGDILINEPDAGEIGVNLIEELTDTKFVVSAQNGIDREVQVWSRLRM